MTTEFKHIPDCVTASTLTPFITENFRYEDNAELCNVFDWLYNYIESKPNMSVEAAVSLLNVFNRGIRIALETVIYEGHGFPKANLYGVGEYYKYFVNKADDAFHGKQDGGIIYEIDRFTFDDPSEKDEYVKSIRMDYRVKLNDAYNLIHMMIEYPINNLYERSKFSRKNVDYSL